MARDSEGRPIPVNGQTPQTTRRGRPQSKSNFCSLRERSTTPYDISRIWRGASLLLKLGGEQTLNAKISDFERRFDTMMLARMTDFERRFDLMAEAVREAGAPGLRRRLSRLSPRRHDPPIAPC